MSEFPIAALMKALRKEQSWDQSDMASYLGVSRVSVSGYETGNHMPSADILLKALSVSLPSEYNNILKLALTERDAMKQEREEKIERLKEEIARLERG